MNKKNLVNNLALFIALLFHIAGAIGILFTPYKNWFIQNTPVNLLVMVVLLIITQKQIMECVEIIDESLKEL